MESTPMAEGSVPMAALRAVINAAVVQSGLTPAKLARAVYASGDAPAVKKIQRRLSGDTPISLEDLVIFIEVLRIPPDEVMRAMVPDLPERGSLVRINREQEMRIHALEQRLATCSASADLTILDEITASERWAIGVLPVMNGPTEESQILSAIRLAATPTRPEIIPPGSTARATFVNDFGDIIGDRALFLGPAVRPLPRPPIDAELGDIVYLSLPAFGRDRKPSLSAAPLHKLPTKSIVVTATTQGAWSDIVAAIVGRALGWGVENASSILRAVNPVRAGDRDGYVEDMNRLRNDGLRAVLGDPAKHMVVHHTGRPVLDDSGKILEPHPLTAFVDENLTDELPFVVVLQESDRMIDFQEHKVKRSDNGQPKYAASTWRQWRDDLTTAAQALDPRRSLVIPIEFPWDQQNDIDGPPEDATLMNQMLWRRSIDRATEVINFILSMGSVGVGRLPDTGDADVGRLLAWYGSHQSFMPPSSRRPTDSR